MRASRLLSSLVAFVIAGCAAPAPRTVTAPPPSVQVVCPVGRIDAECFRRASELCGRAGYDLFDRTGRPATVADAEYGVLEARCRR